MRALRLLLFGSDAFTVRVLERFIESKQLPKIGLVTNENSVLDRYSKQLEIDKTRWPIPDYDTIKSNYDIGFVASFGHLIDRKTIEHLRYGLFNIHPSLLPQYRGSTPVQAAVLDGLQITGCTIMRIPPIPRFDIGDIILQEKLKIHPDEYAKDLALRLADVGSRLSLQVLADYKSYCDNARPQSNEGQSLARKIRPEQGLIEFRKDSASVIDRKVRAYTSFVDLFTFCLNGLRVRLSCMRPVHEVDQLDIDRLIEASRKQVIHRLVDDRSESRDDDVCRAATAGTMYYHKRRRTLCIKCADGRWLAFDCMQLDKRKKLSASDFYNGYMSQLAISSRTTDC